MPRYALEIDHEVTCCSDCPILNREDGVWCWPARRGLSGLDLDEMPEWCPLEPEGHDGGR